MPEGSNQEFKIAPFRHTALSIQAQDEKQLPFLLTEAVRGLARAIPDAMAARRRGREVTEVSLGIGEWWAQKGLKREMTFEELVTLYREKCGGPAEKDADG